MKDEKKEKSASEDTDPPGTQKTTKPDQANNKKPRHGDDEVTAVGRIRHMNVHWLKNHSYNGLVRSPQFQEYAIRHMDEIERLQTTQHEIDLTELVYKDPKTELKKHLEQLYQERFKIRTPPSHFQPMACSFLTGTHFPPKSMSVLLDFCERFQICISAFCNRYGKVKGRNCTNADWKKLVLSHAHRHSLRVIRLRPKPKTAPPIEFNHAGYQVLERLHNLKELEISLAHDYEGVLLDPTCLSVDYLEELVLWHVGPNTSREKLAGLVKRAKRLKQLTLHKPELLKQEDDDDESDDLAMWLQKLAKEKGGNPNLQVTIKE
ncbi:expressed unknown protein [Seminavis robusta]|uniref:Uncharacterized protein n=1 Tax=Seminavis robusta TaxID=568900 RepID=A0A9N8E6F2_9STRA|nr:expressed unknown protein [Seminavis robusta]|eukprot:Sro593_g172310.1 n/a (320) ;mRNA; r:29608-30699